MDNKLQQLTDKLYAEGLEKGKAQGESIVEEAREQAAKIISEAKVKAAQIEAEAKKAAEELTRNTQSEVRSASLQTLSALRSQIETMVVADVAKKDVAAAYANGSFTKELIIQALQAWNPSSDNPVKVVVPESYIAEVKSAIQGKFNAGVDVVFDGKVRVPFRIAPSAGGYYVSFMDEDFENLLKSAIRTKVSQFLFSK